MAPTDFESFLVALQSLAGLTACLSWPFLHPLALLLWCSHTGAPVNSLKSLCASGLYMLLPLPGILPSTPPTAVGAPPHPSPGILHGSTLGPLPELPSQINKPPVCILMKFLTLFTCHPWQ